MAEIEYVIDKEYEFGSFYDGERQTNGPDFKCHISLDHDTVLEMGEYFMNEDPYEVDCNDDFCLLDQLNDALVDALEDYDSYENDDSDDDDQSEDSEDDWDSVPDCFPTWSEELKEDCIRYFKEHTK